MKRPCKFELNSIELAGLDRRDASLWSSYGASDVTNKDDDDDDANDDDDDDINTTTDSTLYFFFGISGTSDSEC